MGEELSQDSFPKCLHVSAFVYDLMFFVCQ